MKICPKCQKTYDNTALAFCGSDGTQLIESQPMTMAAASPQPQQAPNSFAPQSPQPQFSAAPNASQQIVVPPGKKRSWLGNFVGGLTAKAPQALIEIDRPGGSYQPGETVRARIKIQAPDAVAVNQIVAGLVFEENCREVYESTDSAGDTETTYDWRAYPQWLVQQQLAGQIELPAGFEQQFDFAFQIPPRILPTYAGKIVKHGTKARVFIDRPAASDVTTDADAAIVVPFAENETPKADFVCLTQPDDGARISLWLPRLAYRQGETVTGRVLIEPRAELKVRSIALEHSRAEETSGGDRCNVESWDEQTIRLAGESQLKPGAPLQFDFQFQLQSKWQPTYHSQRSRSAASVGVKLNVPWGKDVKGLHAISIYNG